jgi:hypothetical protein
VKTDPGKLLARLERDNERLRRKVADLSSETATLRQHVRANLSRAELRDAVLVAQARFRVSERHACRALGQHRSTQRHKAKGT